MKSFIKDGKLTLLAELFLLSITLLGGIGIPVLNMPIWLAVPVGILASLSAGLLISEGAAVSVGLKPFTNDPLGWRKAKRTYESPDNIIDDTEVDQQ